MNIVCFALGKFKDLFFFQEYFEPLNGALKAHNITHSGSIIIIFEDVFKKIGIISFFLYF